MSIDLSDKISTNHDHGVLQGTVTGPLNFLLHVNIFSEKMEDENDVQFANNNSIKCKLESNEKNSIKN